MVEQWQRILQVCVYGGGYKYILRLLLCMLKMLNECFYKGGSHTRYDIIYFVMNIIKCSCLYFFFNTGDGLLFIIMSIYTTNRHSSENYLLITRNCLKDFASGRPLLIIPHCLIWNNM